MGNPHHKLWYTQQTYRFCSCFQCVWWFLGTLWLDKHSQSRSGWECICQTNGVFLARVWNQLGLRRCSSDLEVFHQCTRGQTIQVLLPFIQKKSHGKCHWNISVVSFVEESYFASRITAILHTYPFSYINSLGPVLAAHHIKWCPQF